MVWLPINPIGFPDIDNGKTFPEVPVWQIVRVPHGTGVSSLPLSLRIEAKTASVALAGWLLMIVNGNV